jgi:transcriptional regulator with XRE-family HTH domain
VNLTRETDANAATAHHSGEPLSYAFAYARLPTMYGDFLRQVRISRSLTQAELAGVVGISQPNLSAYENDRRSPTLDVLNRILVACGYQLVADGGSRSVRCPLPKVGWFPDEDLPPRLPDDPPDEPYRPGPMPSLEQRGSAAWDVLELADAVRCT